jgi:hypothetical protein
VEIEQLHLAAIARAERLIYAETQYPQLAQDRDGAGERACASAQRTRLEIVLVLNMRGET